MATRPRRARALLATALLAAATTAATTTLGPSPAGAAGADGLRINEIQVVGSHNSYHLAASPAETAIRRGVIGAADDQMQYAHAPLPEQFSDQKIRQIELDVFRDDVGGKYANPLLRAAAGEGPYDPAMNLPGTKVLHVQDVDYRSTCLSLVACLEAVEGWSDANPTHMPIAILLELKDTPLVVGDLEFTVPDPWNAAAMDALDAEIRTVVDEDDVITPDDVRGSHDTLEDAVLTDGWPTLEDSRGKVMFLMDNGGGYRTDYLSGHPSLAGRVMFTNAEPGQDDAAFVKRNDARGSQAAIADLVADGYVVRTRSDADTLEAREGDTSARDAAFASGAQWVSTDYPVPGYAEEFGTGFVVEIPGGTVARCNPVIVPADCVAADIDTIQPVAPGPYVDVLYRELLGRPADSGGLAHWSAYLASGGSRVNLVRTLAYSAEANRRRNPDRSYQRYLGRGTDAAAGAYWGTVLGGGTVLERIDAVVLSSTEYLNRNGGTPAGFVDGLYLDVLGRPADAGGRAHFVAALAAGRTRATVARSFIGSTEGRRARVTEEVDTVLGRAPTSPELDSLVRDLRGEPGRARGAAAPPRVQRAVPPTPALTDPTSHSPGRTRPGRAPSRLPGPLSPVFRRAFADLALGPTGGFAPPP